MKNKKIIFTINGKNNLKVIRYAAYLFTEDYYVFLKKKGKNYQITISPKKDIKNISAAIVKKDFESKLKEETLRYEIYQKNKPLREFLIKKAILEGDKIASISQDFNQETTLTKEEKKELEKIIKEVEEELKTYNSKKTKEIAQTWEEKHAKNN